jgi:endonuclease/exonuclease/phosphatase family metal-dependent hydrolase
MSLVRPKPRRLPLVILAAGLLCLLVEGCASRRPVPLVLKGQAVARPDSCSAAGLNVRCVTYNIWGVPGWLTGAPSGRYPRIAQELERLDPDIILLQEAWTSNARRAVPTNGLWVIARGVGQHTLFQQNGLVTLSKFRIVGGEFYPFSRAAFPDRLVNKGALKVTVQMPNGQLLNIWNVHMQDGHATGIRSSQVRELIARVRASEDGQIADLVGGDFNCTPESPLCHELAKGIGPALQQIGGGEAFTTWDGLSKQRGTGQTIDYIFVRERAPFGSLQASQHVAFCADKRQERLSDHFGIQAVVDLKPTHSVAGRLGPSFEPAQYPAILAHRAP